MTPEEARLNLHLAGYSPIPCHGKIPVLEKWQKHFETNAGEIELWSSMFPEARNTGILTRLTPTLDIDITFEPAAEAVEALVRERFEERGYILVRTGNKPKRAVLFRTNEPFPKISAVLLAPDGSEQRLEFLARDQQVVVHGVHPDTRQAYSWSGGEPGSILPEDLPYISAEEAQALVEDVAELVCREPGYRRPEKRKSTRGKPGNGNEPGERTPGGNWGVFENLIEHDCLISAAEMLALSGMDQNPVALYNFLHSQLELRRGTPHLDPAKLGRRFDELWRAVETAVSKAATWKAEAAQPEFASASDGKAFGYSWRWHWHGEVDPIDMRKWLVEGLLPETGTALISGQWGTYKTFVALDLAAAVMTGTDFIRFPLRRQGAVLLFACEGQNEVAIRLTAAFEARGGEEKAPFAWVDSSPRLTDKNAAAILTAMIKHAAEKLRLSFGLEVALVIVDTAGKAAGLTKEGQLNDDAIAKIIMRTLNEVAAAIGTLFVGVAHFGKSVETGTKGSTGFEDDTDFVLALLGERALNGVVANPRLCARKRRSGPNGEEFAFQTKVVDLGPDANGLPVTTLTLEWATEAQTSTRKPKPDRWAKSLRLLRQVMMNMIADCGSEQRPFADGPIVRAVDLELIRAEFYKSYPAVGDEQAKTATRRQAFNRAVNEATTKSLIAIRDIGVITYAWLVTPESSA